MSLQSHSTALKTLLAAAALDVFAGLGFAAVEQLPAATGLYWALTTATTVGYGDVSPKTVAGHVLACIVMLTVVPLFGATFSLFTTSLTAQHVKRVQNRLDHVIKHHPDIPKFEDVDE